MMRKFYLFLFFLLGVGIANAQTGNIVVPNGHNMGVDKIIRDKQGKYLYTVNTAKIVMWDLKTQDQLYTFSVGGRDEIEGIDVSHDGTMIAVAYNGNMKCFSTMSGKLIFEVGKFNYRSGIKFSLDDSSIYSVDDGIVNIDISTKKETKLVSATFEVYEALIDILDASHILITNHKGWQVWNIIDKKLDFEFKFPTETFRVFSLPLIRCVASSSASMKLEFRDIGTGKIVKSFPVISRGDYTLLPSEDNPQFIFNDGNYIGERFYTLYDGLTFLPIRKLTSKGYYFSGKNNELYDVNPDIKAINTKTNKQKSEFNGYVADVGNNLFDALEYNSTNGKLNFIADDVYKSIDLVKLSPSRHKPIPSSANYITYSASGDTIAVFDDRKAYVKNIVTGNVLQPSIKLEDEYDVTGKNLFFSKKSDYVYYGTHSIAKQMGFFYKVSVKTGLSEKLFSYRACSFFNYDPDKALFAFLDPIFERVKVWDVGLNKFVFDIEVKSSDHCQFVSLGADKKRILIVRNGYTEIYDLVSGLLVSKSKRYPYLGDFGLYSCTSDLSIVFQTERRGQVTAYNQQGETLYSIAAHSSSIGNALLSPDNEVLYTLSSDQTTKIWHAKTGKLYGTLYLFNDGNDYVFVDPSGRFDGTEGGIKRMYYYRDRHKIHLDVVYERFYTPNLYQRLLNGEQFDPIDIVIKPSPLVKISYEEATRNLQVTDDVPTYQNKTGFANVTVHATAEEDAVDEIRLFHNGKIVTLTTRNLFVNDAATATDSKKYQVALLPGQNTLRAIALNTQRTESQPDDILVNFSSPTSPTPSTPVPIANNSKRGPVATIEKTATLHLIVVGINAYKNPKMSLNYARADAAAFKDELEKDAKTVLSNVKTYFVTDGEADKNGISNAFAAVKQNSKPQDVFIFYYAGHGVIGDDKEFYLVPNDVADLKNMQDELVQKGIAAKALQQYAIDIQAQKQLFILDACQSAGAFEAMLTNDGNQQKSIAVVARSTGTHWMAASGSQQFANEFSQLGHGAFTYVLLQALQGAGATDKLVTVNGLKNFLQLNVPALMKKYHGIEQHPSSYGYGIDFPVGVVK